MDDHDTAVASHTPASTELVPSVATLDGFSESAAEWPGFSLLDLDPLTDLLVETRNSVYRIVVVHRTEVVVQGGCFFPAMTAARFAGATFGGSLIKLAWIGLGMCMEIHGDMGPIVTSPVRSIRLVQRDRRTH
jgi:hypothetical protein